MPGQRNGGYAFDAAALSAFLITIYREDPAAGAPVRSAKRCRHAAPLHAYVTSAVPSVTRLCKEM